MGKSLWPWALRVMLPAGLPITQQLGFNTWPDSVPQGCALEPFPIGWCLGQLRMSPFHTSGLTQSKTTTRHCLREPISHGKSGSPFPSRLNCCLQRKTCTGYLLPKPHPPALPRTQDFSSQRMPFPSLTALCHWQVCWWVCSWSVLSLKLRTFSILLTARAPAWYTVGCP